MRPRAEHRATLDRIVRDARGRRLATIVFDDGLQLVVPLALLPAGVRPQQVITVSFEVDPGETLRRQQEIRALQDELFGD